MGQELININDDLQKHKSNSKWYDCDACPQAILYFQVRN